MVDFVVVVVLAGGHSQSNGGRGGHGAVRIVYGYLGPGDAVPTNRRSSQLKMLTKVINMQSHWAEQFIQTIIIIETDGQQLMY